MDREGDTAELYGSRLKESDNDGEYESSKPSQGNTNKMPGLLLWPEKGSRLV